MGDAADPTPRAPASGTETSNGGPGEDAGAGSVEGAAATSTTEGTAHASCEPTPEEDDEPRALGASAPQAEASDKKPEPAKPAKKRPRVDRALALSYRKGLPVRGRIEKVIRGGYEVRVGKARGFCPQSQMDLQPVESPETFVGTEQEFRVIQLRRGGEEVVLSRRALLEEDRSEEAKAVRATLIEGGVTQGHVARLADFGAFVDLGAGVLGLVHVSEIAHGRVGKPSDVLKVGDTVRVKVVKLDERRGRISLSIRQAADDPWTAVEKTYAAGGVYPGVVRRVVDFGAFVEMAPGIEALSPADGFPPSAAGWQQGIEIGATRNWRVLSVDAARRRISIVPDAPAPAVEPGVKLAGRVHKVMKSGVFVWLGPRLFGMLPNAATGTPRGTDLARAFPPGKEIEVEVQETDAELRRIRLAVPGVAVRPEAQRPARKPPAREPTKSPAARPAPPPEPPQSFGTSLGDVLKAAIGRRGDDGS